jgi:hypothetical protein
MRVRGCGQEGMRYIREKGRCVCFGAHLLIFFGVLYGFSNIYSFLVIVLRRGGIKNDAECSCGHSGNVPRQLVVLPYLVSKSLSTPGDFTHTLTRTQRYILSDAVLCVR